MIWCTLIFIFLLVFFSILKVIVEEFLLESSTVHFIEWAVMASCNVSYYFFLLHLSISPGWALLASLGMALLSFLFSWGVPATLNHFLGWAEEDEGVGPFFPFFMGLILFLFFVPTGLTKILGIPELFKGQMSIFAAAVLIEALFLSIHLWIAARSEPYPLIHHFCNLLLLIGLMGATLSSVPRSQSWMITTLLTAVVNLEMTAVFYLGRYGFEIFDLEPKFLAQQTSAFLIQVFVVFIMYLFPVFAKLIHSLF